MSEQGWEETQENYSHNPFVDPLSFVENRDLLAKLARAVEILPERERMIVTLYYHEELTLREIGQILNLSEGRICQIFKQVVAHLRAMLGLDAESASVTEGTRAVPLRNPKASMKPARV